MNAADLIDFENDLAERFERGEIKAPLHLAGGNEGSLIEIFKNVAHDDWVLCGWRSHYHCLLKGVPVEMVRRAILDGRSIALTFPAYRVLCSAIVGGIAPIAVGMAWAIKQQKRDEKVWCFIGDMTAETGIVHEAKKYAQRNSLPIIFVTENNEKSVCTDTAKAWGKDGDVLRQMHYRYTLDRPHVGIGKHVSF